MREEGGERAGPQAQSGVKADPVFPTDCNGKWSRSQVRWSRSTPGSYTTFNMYIKWMRVYAFICLCACVRVHAQYCSTLCKPLDCSPTGSSVHGISQEEHWSRLPFPSPGDLSNPQPRHQTRVSFVSCIRVDSLRTLPPGKLMLCLCTYLFILKFYTWPTIG